MEHHTKHSTCPNRAVLGLFLTLTAPIYANLSGRTCTGEPEQQWKFAGSLLQSVDGQCVTAASTKAINGIDINLAKCTPNNPAQQWQMTKSNWITLVVNGGICVNLEGYSTSNGSTVWAFNSCTTSDCKGNCDWMPSGAMLQNTESKLCLDSRGPPPPPAPPPPFQTMRTCAPGSTAEKLPICDTSLSMRARAAWLVSNLTLQEKLNTFMLVGQLQGIQRLNIKTFRWDATDIEGVDDQVFKFNNTCFPHAIGIGATWDRDMIKTIGQITAIEARVLEEKYWTLHNGSYIGATNFDGGPLANVAYDPRVGRTSEMYGECPYHTGQVGAISTIALQNKTNPEPNGDYFLQTSQVTRHFITDHGSRPDNGPGNYTGSLASLEDEFLPPFKAFQVEGDAEGIMFSISALNGMADTANTYLYEKLRTEWKSECIAQTDCCGTFRAAVSAHKNFNSTQEAVVAALKAGIQLDYGDNVAADITNAINTGELPQAMFDDAVTRAFLTRFRLGEFDEERNPFWQKYDVGLLDSDAHRLAARQAMAASVVLLQNNDDTLPLSLTKLKKVAVVGPWSDCKDRSGGYGGSMGYLNNYKGQPAYINTILDAIQSDGENSGFAVVFAQGSTNSPTGTPNNTALAEAVEAATGADVVILALGLGNDVEGEGLDRSWLTFPSAQQNLLETLTNATRNTPTKLVLAVNSAGGVDFDPSGLDAVLQIWYGGQETGGGLADILFGRVSPSGRLPLTIHPSSYVETGVGPVSNLNMTFPGNGSAAGKVQGRTYRYISSQATDAIFSFGWGLSYSKFEYLSLNASKTIVSTMVANVGQVAASEVVELYVGLNDARSALPPVQYALVGFQKIHLEPNQTALVTLNIDPDSLTVVLPSGDRVNAIGDATFTVAGHLPSDPRATMAANSAHVSNQLSKVIQL